MGEIRSKTCEGAHATHYQPAQNCPSQVVSCWQVAPPSERGHVLNADGSAAGIKGRSAAVLKETAKGVKGGVSSVASTLSKDGGGGGGGDGEENMRHSLVRK